MNIVLSSGTELITNWSTSTDRRGGNITLNNATITRPNGVAVNGTIFNAYNGSTNFNSTLTVNGASTIRNLQIARTGNHILGFEMPVVVNSGATLTLQIDNPNGQDSSYLIAFRGPNATTFPADGFTIEAGGTVQGAHPPRQLRFGQTASSGKAIVARNLLRQSVGPEAALQHVHDRSHRGRRYPHPLCCTGQR